MHRSTITIVGPINSLKHLDRQVGLKSTYYIFQLIKRAVCWPDAVNKVRFSCWPEARQPDKQMGDGESAGG